LFIYLDLFICQELTLAFRHPWLKNIFLSQYHLFIAILCVKMTRVNKALQGEYCAPFAKRHFRVNASHPEIHWHMLMKSTTVAFNFKTWALTHLDMYTRVSLSVQFQKRGQLCGSLSVLKFIRTFWFDNKDFSKIQDPHLRITRPIRTDSTVRITRPLLAIM